MPDKDSTKKLIKLRFIALLNQVFLQVAVPALFIIQSDLSHYGIWLAVNSYSSFLALLDLGFFAVIPTSAMAHSSEQLSDKDRFSLVAMRKYSTSVSSLGIVTLVIFLFLGRLLNVDVLKSNLFLFGVLAAINVLLVLKLRYFEASYRSVNSTTGFERLTFHSLLTTISTISVIYLSGSILGILACNILISILFLFLYRLKGDAFIFNQNVHADVFQILREFFRRGITYQFFPIGYLMINQGIVIIIQHIGGFEVLGQLGAIRAIAGIFRQLSGMIINAAIPQVSLLLKSGNYVDAKIRFQSIKKFVYSINMIAFFVLMFGIFAYYLNGSSTYKSIPVITCLFFIISAALDVPWNTWLILSLSVNSHVNLGLRFMISSLVTLVITIPAYEYMGISGIAAALLVQDLMMTPHTIRQGKAILQLL